MRQKIQANSPIKPQKLPGESSWWGEITAENQAFQRSFGGMVFALN
jgi:hypothetical protein